jgi:hypothetical protein
LYIDSWGREREREISYGEKREYPLEKTQSYLEIILIYTNEVVMPHAHTININHYNNRKNVEGYFLSIISKKGTS